MCAVSVLSEADVAGVSALVTTTGCEELDASSALACLRGDYMNANTTPYGSHGIVYERLADFGNPRSAAPTQIGSEALAR